MQTITDSRLKVFRRCPREERIAYQLGVRAPSTEAQEFGTLLHLQLEAFWLGLPLPKLPDGCDPFVAVQIEELMLGYAVRWGRPAGVIGAEVKFDLPLVNPDTGAPSRTFRLAGKIDAMMDDESKVLVVEHKSSSQDIGPGSQYMERLPMDSQVSMYYRAAREMGHDVSGILYDVVGKVKLRPARATPVELRKYTKDGRLYANQRDVDETPEEYRERVRQHIADNPDSYYQRATVVRLDSEVQEFERELWQQASALREAMRLGVAPRNPEACMRYGQTCAYFGICTGTESIDDVKWVRADPHPELNEKPKEEADHG